MRAKTINFERGQDPKRAMNVGLYSQLQTEFQNAAELFKYLIKYLDVIVGFHVKFPIKRSDMGKFTPNIQGPLEEYLSEVVVEDDDYSASGQVYPYGVIDDLMDYYLSMDMIKESLDFERGHDPKQSIGIGKEATYRKIAQMMKADGWTPQDPKDSDSAAGWAVEYKHHDLLKFIIDHDSPSNLGGDLILWAVQNRDTEMVKLILSYHPIITNWTFLLNRASNSEKIYNILISYYKKLLEKP